MDGFSDLISMYHKLPNAKEKKNAAKKKNKINMGMCCDDTGAGAPADVKHRPPFI